MTKAKIATPMPTPYPDWLCAVGIDPLIVWGVATGWEDFPVAKAAGGINLALKFSAFTLPIPSSPIYQAFTLKQPDVDNLFATIPKGPRNFNLRLELAMPMGANRGRDAPGKILTIQPEKRRSPGSSQFFGVIDDGCPYAQTDFIRQTTNGSESRVLYLWDQSNKNSIGAFIPYGREIDLSLNELGQIGEDELYAAAGYEAARRANTHGAHVLSLLAARKFPRNRLTDPSTQSTYFQSVDPTDLACNADIGFVQLPMTAISDTSGLWLAHQVLDGVDYLLAAADKHRVVVLNISYGPLQGPHDGTSFFEEALDAKIQAWRKTHRGCRLDVILPTGNNFDTRTHADLSVPSTKSAQLAWFVPPNSEKSGFLEIWIDPVQDPNKIEIKLTEPSGESIACKADQAAYLKDANSQIYAGLIFTSSPARSTQGLQALLVSSPTDAPNNFRAIAPSGRWQIEIRNSGAQELKVQAYIARNGVTLLRKRRGRQSYFLDEQYDPGRYLRAAADDPVGAASQVKRRGSLSGIASGLSSLVASGYRMRNVDHPDFNPSELKRGPQSIADHPGYSSAGQGRGGVARDPDVSAPTDYSWVLRGIPAGGGRGRSVFWMVGTSTAAPQVARALLSADFSKLPQRYPLSGSYTNSLFSTKYIL
jgi:hypothetical protein